MGRVSHAQAQANRRQVMERASQLFREQGTGVSVADLMKAAGLTHGGFYKQFASKEALIDEAVIHAVGELAEHHATTLEEHEGDRVEAQQALIDGYLSVRHRDNPASGCRGGLCTVGWTVLLLGRAPSWRLQASVQRW